MRWYFNFLFPRIRAYSRLDLRSISTNFYIIIGWRYKFLNCDSIYRTNENCMHGWMGNEGMKDVSAKSRCRVDARRARAWAALVVSRASKAGRGTSGESPSSLRASERASEQGECAVERLPVAPVDRGAPKRELERGRKGCRSRRVLC